MFRGTFAVLDMRALRNNVEMIQRQLRPGTQMMVAVKADAYGHGAVRVVSELERAGVRHVAVATLEEAMELRGVGCQVRILILGAIGPMELEIAASNEIDVIYSDTWGDWADLPKLGSVLRVHLPLDTGMNRMGAKSVEEAKHVVAQIEMREDMEWAGVYTHLACSDVESDAHASEQVARFQAWVEALEEAGFTVPMTHVSNSGGTLRNAAWHFDMVRVGIAVYGYSPDSRYIDGRGLEPVMSVYSMVTRVADVMPGETVGYGATFTADRAMKIATICIGYADGYPRVLSNRGAVLIHGQEARVVGRVCMDQIMVDVTDFAEVKVGDFVTIFGHAAPRSWVGRVWQETSPDKREYWLSHTYTKEEIALDAGFGGDCSDGDNTSLHIKELSLDRVASDALTISYELLCQISSRVSKIYVE